MWIIRRQHIAWPTYFFLNWLESVWLLAVECRRIKVVYINSSADTNHHYVCTLWLYLRKTNFCMWTDLVWKFKCYAIDIWRKFWNSTVVSSFIQIQLSSTHLVKQSNFLKNFEIFWLEKCFFLLHISSKTLQFFWISLAIEGTLKNLKRTYVSFWKWVCRMFKVVYPAQMIVLEIGVLWIVCRLQKFVLYKQLPDSSIVCIPIFWFI